MNRYILLLLLMFIPIMTFPTMVIGYSPANIKIYINEKKITFDEDPIVVNGRILVPLRKIAEIFFASIDWKDPQVLVKKGDVEVILTIGSSKALINRKIIFFEQPPVIVNGRTMVSLRFITEALGAKVVWDSRMRIVKISSEGLELPGNENLYKNNVPLIGPVRGPDFEEAKAYVLSHKLLKDIENMQYTPIRFSEFSDTYTMIAGKDEFDRNKALWLKKDKYTGQVVEVDSVMIDEGIDEERVYFILEQKGIIREMVQKIYLAPYNEGNVCWYVVARTNDKEYYYCLDFKTGVIVIENINTI
ncbi:MAG: copper amine oxidase N-terminal domain-containing protein [Thermoanaerobacter sp.]|nr:copper amine oxidase N-terminal domain-containing protein [Thermoanaerobacter sp.]